MEKARYIQRGESLDYTNSGEEKINEGEIIPLITRIGVAGTDIDPGKTGSVHVCGVFEITKTGNTAIPMGTAVFFDGAGITDQEETAGSGESDPAASNIPAGYAAAGAGIDDTAIAVKLLG
ncbi:MAG: DUF2190 family protein [Hungatella sp.]|jgi:predicted RecA/RadA family phage recombinase|nr:DUF2190 family protein [Hungatella sp.]